MSVTTLQLSSWNSGFTADIQQQAINALENGHVVYIPQLPFPLLAHEISLLKPNVCDARRKNICYDLISDKISGQSKEFLQVVELKQMLQRYALQSRQLLQNLFPHYMSQIIHARTSYRPVEIAGRIPQSPRKDDTRLHVDAFPSTPTQGKRILRVFTNVNPHGQERVWRIGDTFANVVQKFAPQISAPLFGAATMQKILKITRGYRTAYDHYMLGMHNRMKYDQHYQDTVSQQEMRFAPGSTWFVYTDQVSHAAMAGQYVFEQTFYLPVEGQQKPDSSPLRVLERYLQKSLI